MDFQSRLTIFQWGWRQVETRTSKQDLTPDSIRNVCGGTTSLGALGHVAKEDLKF